MGSSGKPLHYKGCTFHRVIPGFMCEPQHPHKVILVLAFLLNLTARSLAPRTFVAHCSGCKGSSGEPPPSAGNFALSRGLLALAHPSALQQNPAACRLPPPPCPSPSATLLFSQVPGRRLHSRRRQRRRVHLRRTVRRRVGRRHRAPLAALPSVHGQRGAKHKRVAILPHHCRVHFSPRRQAPRLWLRARR